MSGKHITKLVLGVDKRTLRKQMIVKSKFTQHLLYALTAYLLVRNKLVPAKT